MQSPILLESLRPWGCYGQSLSGFLNERFKHPNQRSGGELWTGNLAGRFLNCNATLRPPYFRWQEKRSHGLQDEDDEDDQSCENDQVHTQR